MGIRIDPHTLERAEERGTNEDEIKDVIHTGFSVQGKYGRKGKGGKIVPQSNLCLSLSKWDGVRIENFMTAALDEIIRPIVEVIALAFQTGLRQLWRECIFGRFLPREIAGDETINTVGIDLAEMADSFSFVRRSRHDETNA